MPAQILGNPGYVVGLNQAILGSAPSNAVFQAQLDQANASNARTFAINYVNTLGDTNAALSAKVLGNLGITNATLQTALEQAFAAFQTARGAVVYRLLELLQGLEGDVTFGAAAATYNNAVTSNFAYSSDPNSLALRPTSLKTTSLTSATDVLNLVGNDLIINAGQVFVPGGNDRVNSLQDEDQISVTGTNATLNATLGISNDNGAATITPVLNGIQTINASFTGSGGAAVNQLDLQDTAAGVNAINVQRVNDGILAATIDNIPNVPANLSISNSNQGGQQVAFLFNNTSASGANDATTLTLTNVRLGTFTLQETASETVDQGVETVNLVSAGNALNFVGSFVAEDIVTMNITGAANLALGAPQSAANAQGNYTSGFANAAGSLRTVDASAYTGNLSINLANAGNAGGATAGALISAVPDGLSSGDIAFRFTGGTGNDTVRIFGQAGLTDTIDGGTGTDTVQFFNNGTANFDYLEGRAAGATTEQVRGFEALQVWNTGNANASVFAVRYDQVNGDPTTELRNATNNVGEATQYNLVNMSAAEAAAITIRHSGHTNFPAGPANASNALADNVIDVDVADGVTTVGVTLADGINSDPRFNFRLYSDSDRTLSTVVNNTFNYDQARDAAVNGVFANAVTNLTLTDSDTESNTVQLLATSYTAANAARGAGTSYTGTITLNGGSAGTFLNLDATANMYRYDQTGSDQGDAVGVVEPGNGAAERLVAASILAGTNASNVIVRVSNSIASNGGQNIQMGTGNDTVIFDALNDTRAGLTISDTVAGGAGSDTIALDGDGARVTISASEWTNVTGFENIRLLGNGQADNNARGAVNSYNLTLTNEFLANNGVADGGVRRITIINDSDPANDQLGVGDTAATAVERGVTIDARTLSANNTFTYNGEEGASRTADRFILADANINGAAVIDGGAVRTGGTNNASNLGNADVIEVRNAAVVTIGDLARVQNVGTLEFTNDTASVQTSILQLDNATVEALVNSTRTSAAGNTETLNISGIDNPILPAAFTQLNIDATGVSGTGGANLQLNIALGGGVDTVIAGAGNDTINGGGGADDLTGGGGSDTFRFIAPAANGTDLIRDFTVGAVNDVIGLLEGGGGWNAAGTAPGAGTQLALAAADYVEGVANITNLVAATHNNRVVELTSQLTTAQITANVSAAATAAIYVVVFNSTNSKAEIWFDTDWNDVGNRVQVASLDNITTLVGTNALAVGNFAEYA